MNSPQTDTEPLKIHEAVGATAYVVLACASVAIIFATLATCEVASGITKRFFKKGVPHVP
jgi:hypothetical protein